jgi:hypothetical protein
MPPKFKIKPHSAAPARPASAAAPARPRSTGRTLVIVFSDLYHLELFICDYIKPLDIKNTVLYDGMRG